MPKAFVTGGTGFIGSHLVEELRRSGYEEVRCLVRQEPKWLEGVEATLVRGGLSDVEALWEAVKDVDYVYHVAGITRATDWATFEQGNVRATMNLLGAIQTVNPGIKKVLITSSLAAVGRSTQAVATEETPLHPISRYGRSKAEMERALHEPNQTGKPYVDELPIVVVRPSSVYGPREADIFTMIRTASQGIFPILGLGNKPDLTLVHVRDLVRGMVDAAESDVTTGRTYFLGSEQQYTWNEVKQAVGMALGRKLLGIHVPPPLVTPVGALSELAGKLTGQYPPLNREKAREARWACKMCSSEKAMHDFNYHQTVSLAEGMAETVAWYRANGWLS
jgi:dihydroflavonol-4-reductase